jgi:monofunctional biosynthetic peptidoglycan transglycosylase
MMIVWKKILKLIRNIALIFVGVSVVWTILAGFIPVLVTPLMLIRSIESIVDGEMPKNSKEWIPIKEMSPHIINAVVASEDNNFLNHYGFSFNDLHKAWKHNQKGKRIRGGSTISQQTAKNVFLWNKRSYLRKGLEAWFTVLIEVFWTKKRIMEVYLNIIEMGDGIYGIQAASLEYFGKNASELSRSQAASIAVCLPNPRKYNPVKPSSYIRKRKHQIQNLMLKLPKVSFE